jgi:hypothetical protein
MRTRKLSTKLVPKKAVRADGGEESEIGGVEKHQLLLKPGRAVGPRCGWLQGQLRPR